MLPTFSFLLHSPVLWHKPAMVNNGEASACSLLIHQPLHLEELDDRGLPESLSLPKLLTPCRLRKRGLGVSSSSLFTSWSQESENALLPEAPSLWQPATNPSAPSRLRPVDGRLRQLVKPPPPHPAAHPRWSKLLQTWLALKTCQHVMKQSSLSRLALWRERYEVSSLVFFQGGDEPPNRGLWASLQA